MLTSKRIFIRDYMADVAERATRAFKTIMSATEGNIPKRRKAETQRICLSNSIEKILVEAVLLEVPTQSDHFTAHTPTHSHKHGSGLAPDASRPKTEDKLLSRAVTEPCLRNPHLWRWIQFQEIAWRPS
eukprot:Blabericola_migrator_1__4674@NODE_2470_length_2713_cov_41_682162_g1547_i0_p2_GENE_NODE_2470_length_2713_cov_41_682162_g1547_i0NODE_2470_length_2713_cov_41_682162_g1547_i0_p2_ORF_typecomplete_len129_score20_25NifQ/PF04891_12/0_028_NODE_2470_length_2713_cov_41_682162_g1547_i08971283